MIPKIIWQTYRTRSLPTTAAAASESWRRLNPDWKYSFWDDDEIAAFMDQEFPGDLSELFHALPIGVMRADVWRYAVLQRRGGVYADIDTLCSVPIASWGTSGARLMVSLENKIHFCQWTIAAESGHPVFDLVLRLIVERARPGIDLSSEHFVHEHTGPGIWTRAMRQILNLENLPVAEIYQKHRNAAALAGIRILPMGTFERGLVRHAFGSIAFRGEGYASWTEERDSLNLRHKGRMESAHIPPVSARL
jgi:mannosyltransferase OCH1-like enzyme